jgi:isopenicillin N synthase-like dioxygenase
MTVLQVVDKKFSQVPIIDISALVDQTRKSAGVTHHDCFIVADEIRQACQDYGFFILLVMELMHNYKSS